MNSNSGTFSADVQLHLIVGEQKYAVGSLGSGLGYLRHSQDIDELHCELETIVDGKVTRWSVRLKNPITSASKRFEYESEGVARSTVDSNEF